MAARSKYDEKKHVAAVLLSAVDGATWNAIAARCEVSEKTVRTWADPEKGHPAFVEAVELAKSASNDAVKTGLFRNATGQTTTSKTKERVVERILPPKNAKERARLEALGLIDEEGLILVYREKETETTTEHKGETGAQMGWLCNRVPSEWQHVAKIEGGGKSGELLVRIIDDIPEE